VEATESSVSPHATHEPDPLLLLRPPAGGRGLRRQRAPAAGGLRLDGARSSSARARPCASCIPILGKGYELIVVHGNGPQVGNILIQAEEAADKVAPQSLDFCVAQTEGSMGFLLELAFDNELPRAGFRKQVVTIMTQVEVDAADPGVPQAVEAGRPVLLARARGGAPEDGGWTMVEDAGRGLAARSSPRRSRARCAASRSRPRSSNRGHIVIAAGGGGIPVVVSDEGEVRGVEAVIDKDYAASMLAASLSANLFIVLTGVDRVSKDFGKPTQQELAVRSTSTRRSGCSREGSSRREHGTQDRRGDQVRRGRGHEVLITRAESLSEALEGRTGTSSARSMSEAAAPRRGAPRDGPRRGRSGSPRSAASAHAALRLVRCSTRGAAASGRARGGRAGGVTLDRAVLRRELRRSRRRDRDARGGHAREHRPGPGAAGFASRPDGKTGYLPADADRARRGPRGAGAPREDAARAARPSTASSPRTPTSPSRRIPLAARAARLTRGHGDRDPLRRPRLLRVPRQTQGVAFVNSAASTSCRPTRGSPRSRRRRSGR
jgi:carbamate kinase